MIVTEPYDLFLKRASERERQIERERRAFEHRVANPTEHQDGWDDAIMSYFVSQPGAVLLFMGAVNDVVKKCRAKRKRDREQAKIIIIRSIGRLIRQGRLKRVRRRYVRVNEAEVPHVPVIPISLVRSSSAAFQARVSEGSTAKRMVIHPAVFI